MWRAIPLSAELAALNAPRVRREGVEPSRPKTHGSEPCAAASYATSALTRNAGTATGIDTQWGLPPVGLLSRGVTNRIRTGPVTMARSRAAADTTVTRASARTRTAAIPLTRRALWPPELQRRGWDTRLRTWILLGQSQAGLPVPPCPIVVRAPPGTRTPFAGVRCITSHASGAWSGTQCRDSRTRTCDFAAPDRAPCQSGPYPVEWRRRESNPLRQRLQGAPASLAVIPMSSDVPGRPKQGRPGTPELRAAWRAALTFPAVELSSSEHIPLKAVLRRGGRNRTCNAQFWRLPFWPLNYAPMKFKTALQVSWGRCLRGRLRRLRGLLRSPGPEQH